MALPLGKLAILVGAGIFGSVLAKETRVLDVSDFVSGAFKIAFRQLKRDDSTSPVKRPQSDALMAQVNSLRQELQMLARDGTITIVNSSRPGTTKYGTMIIVVVVGYGYVWWKGWKLPDMMFATRRSLSDACSTIAKQLETVYASIAATKKKLSSRLDQLDSTLDECAALTGETKEEISALRGRTDVMGLDVRSVRSVIELLENKIGRIEAKQIKTNDGVKMLCEYAWNLENNGRTKHIQASPSNSSRPALDLPPASPSRATPSGSSRLSLEIPPVSPTSKSVSLPSNLSSEPPSPSQSIKSHQVVQPLRSSVSVSGLQDRSPLSEVLDFSCHSKISDGSPAKEDKVSGSSSSGLFGSRLPSIGASFLTRTRSATNAVLQHTRSSKQAA